MKKLLFVFLLFNSFIFSQEKDIVNNEIYTFLRKQNIESYEERNIITQQLDNIIKTSKDSVLVNKCKELNVFLLKKDIATGSKSDFSNIDKDLLKKFKIKEDKFNKKNYYNHKDKSDSRFPLTLNYNSNDSMSLLVFGIKYYDKNWLFANFCTFLIDGNQTDINFKDIKRDTQSGGYVVESEYFYVNSKLLKLLEEITKTENEISVRFYGDKGTKDVVLKDFEVNLIKDVLSLYNSSKIE